MAEYVKFTAYDIPLDQINGHVDTIKQAAQAVLDNYRGSASKKPTIQQALNKKVAEFCKGKGERKRNQLDDLPKYYITSTDSANHTQYYLAEVDHRFLIFCTTNPEM